MIIKKIHLSRNFPSIEYLYIKKKTYQKRKIQLEFSFYDPLKTNGGKLMLLT